jgi:hypothetical protein
MWDLCQVHGDLSRSHWHPSRVWRICCSGWQGLWWLLGGRKDSVKELENSKSAHLKSALNNRPTFLLCDDPHLHNMLRDFSGHGSRSLSRPLFSTSFQLFKTSFPLYRWCWIVFLKTSISLLTAPNTKDSLLTVAALWTLFRTRVQSMHFLRQWQRKYWGLYHGLKSLRRMSSMCCNSHLWLWDFALPFHKLSLEDEGGVVELGVILLISTSLSSTSVCKKFNNLLILQREHHCR